MASAASETMLADYTLLEAVPIMKLRRFGNRLKRLSFSSGLIITSFITLIQFAISSSSAPGMSSTRATTLLNRWSWCRSPPPSRRRRARLCAYSFVCKCVLNARDSRHHPLASRKTLASRQAESSGVSASHCSSWRHLREF